MHWHRFALFLLALGLSAGPLAREAGGGRTNALSPNQLRAEIDRLVSAPRFSAAAWGIKVVALNTSEVLYEHQAEKLLKPASNAKLFTGALALDRFEPGHRIRTSVYARTRPGKDGILDGDLIIYGRGDPSISARFRNGEYEGLLRPLAKAIADAGINVVNGDVIGDETYFIGPPYGATWSWDDLQYYYGARVSALTVQDNVIDIFLRPGTREGDPCTYTLKPETDFMRFINRTVTGSSNGYPATAVHRPLGSDLAYLNGSVPLGHGAHDEAVTVPDPARWFITMLREELRQAGVKVKGNPRTRAWPSDAITDVQGFTELAFIESAPMEEMVAKMMKSSQNLYAQLLLLQAGAAASTRDTNIWTEDRGLETLRRFGEKAGISRSELLLEEGSGLSRGALVTPNAIIKLLSYMRRHPRAENFRAALPVAGVDGTLRRRLAAPGLKGNVRAKTGSIRYVSTLSGYMDTASGEPLAFSLMLNAYNPPGGQRDARAELDKIVALLWRLERAGKVPANSETATN